MNKWICLANNKEEIQNSENYQYVHPNDIIYSYSQDNEEGAFLINKAFLVKDNGILAETDIQKKIVDLPYSIMYLCKCGNFLYQLNSKEIAFLLEENFDSCDQFSHQNENRLVGAKNIILYGVPGSGKSHKIKTEYELNGCITEKLVFHPEYSYNDFVGQIMPIIKNDIVVYEFSPGPFTKILKKAYNNPSIMHILVIDEINRGNAPAIFGEIFQLLDRDKDGNSQYAINHIDIAKAIYDDSTKPIRIPSNLWIIGTMNTSDQNIFTLDTAFQRRFSMILVENRFDNSHTYRRTPIPECQVTWESFCNAINNIIIQNSDNLNSMEDKRLGVYFLTEYELREKAAFACKILKYLWDDVFKFEKSILFNTDVFPTLEAVIHHFNNTNGQSCFDIFTDDIRRKIGV